jgi:hypothetical protein
MCAIVKQMKRTMTIYEMEQLEKRKKMAQFFPKISLEDACEGYIDECENPRSAPLCNTSHERLLRLYKNYGKSRVLSYLKKIGY